MLTTEQITEIARSQAQFLSYALEHAQKALDVMPSVRKESDANVLLRALESHFISVERAYEGQFAKLGGFIDVRMGQTPVDLLTEWVTLRAEREPAFYVLCQWSIAQRLRSRLLIEMAATPVAMAALARFCIAIREEARRCVQQSRGEGANQLADQVESFSALIEGYQDRMASANAKRA